MAADFRVISSEKEIDELDRDERIVHLAFRASNSDIFRLLQICPYIEMIRVTSPYYNSMSRAGRTFLGIQGVKVVEV